MNSQIIKELEEKIAEVKRRIPPHSVLPSMLEELEELEEQLERAKEKDRKL